MNSSDAVKELIELQSETDTETAHILADDVLCDMLESLGFHEVVTEYQKIAKWHA